MLLAWPSRWLRSGGFRVEMEAVGTVSAQEGKSGERGAYEMLNLPQKWRWGNLSHLVTLVCSIPSVSKTCPANCSASEMSLTYSIHFSIEFVLLKLGLLSSLVKFGRKERQFPSFSPSKLVSVGMGCMSWCLSIHPSSGVQAAVAACLGLACLMCFLPGRPPLLLISCP